MCVLDVYVSAFCLGTYGFMAAKIIDPFVRPNTILGVVMIKADMCSLGK